MREYKIWFFERDTDNIRSGHSGEKLHYVLEIPKIVFLYSACLVTEIMPQVYCMV